MSLLLTLLASFLSIIVGLFVYLKNPKSWSNSLFSFFTLVLGLWIIADFVPLISSDEVVALFWLRTNMALAIWLCYSFFLFAHTFPEAHFGLNLSYFIGSFVLVSAVSILALTPLIFSGININGSQISPIAGQAIPIFGFSVALFLAGSFVILVRKYNKAKGREKMQFRIVLLGALLMFSLILANNFFAVVLLNNSALVVLSPLYLLVFVFMVAYAMVKHRFMDLHLVVVRTATFAVVVLLSAIIYIFGIVGMSFFLGRSYIPASQLIYETLLTTILALSFQPLRRLIERVTDPILFKGHFETEHLLREVSKTLSATIVMKDLSNNVLKLLVQELRCRSASIVVTDRKHKIIGSYAIGLLENLKFSVSERQLTSLFSSAEKGPLVLEDLSEGAAKETFHKANISILFPLRVKEELVGFFILSEKESGDIYSANEISVLEILMPEIAVAISNAQSYEEIVKFNITLKEEVRKATHKLKVANDKLKVLDRLKDDFVSVASHELRTPMTSIKSYMWMVLNNRAGEVPEKVKIYLERAYKATERLINLVNDMLNVSRIEGGRIELTNESFDVVSLSNEVVQEIRPKADEKAIYLKVDSATPFPVIADRNRVREVIINLIGNGIKFVEKGGITLKFRHKNSKLGGKVKKYVEVSVIDTGPGILKEEQERLFKKFGRLDNSYISVASSSGTGLGLYISKSLVELMGGQIGIDSKLGEGSNFWFTLPETSQD